MAIGRAIDLPGLGLRLVMECSLEPGHYVWWSFFGWHDCTPCEDSIIGRKIYGTDSPRRST